MRTSSELREGFLRFFEERGHARVPSSPLVPAGDPTLLFTNAGMVQFKDVFLGLERRPYARAATAQKCMRVSGKHNDLENVGPSAWHHTFFEMLGNFSFGDYFKADAIRYAWEFLTGVVGIDPRRLVLTVFRGDDEAYGAWLAIPDVRPERILRMGENTNFWSMADIGPCGPTSELHYDWGPEHCTCGEAACSVALDNDCERWLEVWNLVFMQYDQRPDGTRVPLPKPGVDTGMGLERLAAVVQGTHTTYGTDLFTPIMDRVQALLGHSDDRRRELRTAYRVLADHGRAMTFLVADGVLPGNEGRSYVLRMITRRALRFGRQAGFDGPFLGGVVDAVIDAMGGAYPDLRRQQGFIRDVVRGEEERFQQTLQSGLARLDEAIAAVERRGERLIPGEEVFRLYDTYGFPREMTRDVAREHGLEIDWAGFEAAMEAQRERARAAGAFRAAGQATAYARVLAESGPTEFLGYDTTSDDGRVVALLRDGIEVAEARSGAEVEVVLSRTPFYAESGGQVGDTGELIGPAGRAEVADTQRPVAGMIAHRARVVAGALRLGDDVAARVDAERRRDIMRNHTATHLLHAALREVLGEHARQAGSLVAPDRLRFDVQHLRPIADEELRRVDDLVNAKILDALPVVASQLPYREAIALGAMALFGEKYGDVVRVVTIDDYSRELCGGTHLGNTGEIGLFRITAESAVAAGVRRIEAVTGRGARAATLERDEIVARLADLLRASPADLPARVERLQQRVRDLERQVERARASRAREPVRHTVEVDGAPVAVWYVRQDGLSREALRAVADHTLARLGPGAVLAASAGEGGAALVAKVSPEFASPLPAGDLVRLLAGEAGGRGGGRAELAEGGGADPDRLEAAVTRLPELLARKRPR